MEKPETVPNRKRYEAPRLEALGTLADRTMADVAQTTGENAYS